MRLTLVTMALLAAAAAGCKPPPDPVTSTDPLMQPPPPPGPDSEARTIFSGRCSPCHGASGGGDGPAAVALNPHPRNFHDAAWQTATTDQQIETVIRQGGAAVGKSPAMPANPDLADKPAVVAALRTIIRGFRQ